MSKSLFVYGTLRTGGYFSRRLSPYVCKSIRIVELSGIEMYSLGAYPCAILTNNDNHFVIGELRDYSNLSDEEWGGLLEEMDKVENVRSGFYQRIMINTSLGETTMYVANRIAWFDAEKKKRKLAGHPFQVLNDWAQYDPAVAKGIKNVKVGKA